MPRNFVTVNGTVNIDGAMREKEIQLLDVVNGTTTVLGKGMSNPTTGEYSITTLKERNSYLIGYAHTPQGSHWQGSKAYAVGDRVLPVTPNNRWYECTVAGTSGATQPTWPTSGTVMDGTVEWTHRGLIEGPVIRGPFFQPDPIADPNTVFLFRGQELVPNDEVSGLGPTMFSYPTMQSTTRRWGNVAPLFNGTNSMYRYAPIPVSVFLSDFTIDAWIYMTAVPTDSNKPIFFWGDLAGNPNRVMMSTTSAGKVDFYMEINNGNNMWPISTANLPVNQWVHIAGERFNNKLYLYVNGVLAVAAVDVNQSAGIVQGAGHFTYLGSGRASSVQRYWPGVLAELRVSNIGRYQGQNFAVPTGPYTL